jgi:hypothetical protein
MRARLRYDPGVRGPNKSDVEPKDGRADHASVPRATASGPAWKRVCAASEVATNGMKEFPVGDLDILIVHTGAGFVAYALCPHEAVRLETACMMDPS